MTSIANTASFYSPLTATGASTSPRTDAPEEKTSAYDRAVSAFMTYQEMTPAEKIRDAILKRMGLTEDQLEALPPEERAKIEESIKEEIEAMAREKIEEKGLIVDVLA